MTEQNLTKLTINTLTKSQYQALYNSGDISYTEIYLITDDNGTGVYALANNVYTKAEIDEIIANLPSGGGGSGSGVDLSDYYTKSEITALLANKANTSDLSDYVEIADLANVATSGDYNDLSNTPTIPSKTSDLTNDSGYVSSSSLSTVATSGSYNDLTNKPDLTVYETKAEAFSGDYDDLTNKPDLSAYQTVSNAFSGDYDDLTNKPDLTVYQTIANAFSGSYNDLTDKPTIPAIPTNISTFTNDSGYQTASNVNTAIATALTGYATESYVQTAVQNLGNVFTIKGSVSTVANLPSTNNSIGDVYYVAEKQAGYIWIEIDNVAQWEELGETIDLSNYVQTSDLTWNNISSKPTFATVATSGSYNDLINKPTIPDAVSGTNDGTNWTSITIGNTTYNIPSGGGSAPSNMVTTNTTQTISGSKTFTNTVTFSGSNNTTGNVVFTGRNPIKMTAPSGSGSSTGFTLFNSNNYEKGYLQYIDRQDALYLGRWSGGSPSSSPKYAQNIGFLSESGGTGYRVLMPNKTSTGSSSATNNTYYIPTEITNGTTTVKASSDGIIDISSLISGGGGGTTVSGTNDGTNWTSLTIGSDTYGIPSGGGGGSYSAGTGIDITNNTIAIDSTVVALKSDIPSVSGSYSGSYWTRITINGTTKSIPSGGSSADAVDLTSNQNITGVKTFVGKQKLRFKQTGSNDTLGFTAYDYNNTEVGNLQIANRTVSSNSNMYVTLGNFSTQNEKAKVGFRIQPNSSQYSYNFVMPYGTYSDFNANTYATNADITIPCAFTDGTTTIKANASGLVDLSSLNLGGGSSTSGSVVTGTNDGTNWTSLTINGSTYNIPAGGSSSGGGSSAGNGAIYYHNVRLFFGISDTANYAKVIEFSMLTKSATQILTMNELISQVSALQNEPYNDSVVGVIYGQVYQYNNRGAKEQILGFGLTGTSSSPNFYAVVRNDSGRTTNVSISATNSTSFTQTIQWIDNLQKLIGYERTNNCYDIVTGGSSGATSGGGIVDINDIPLVKGDLAVKEVPLYDEQTGEPLLDENDNPITEERLGIDDTLLNDIDNRLYALEQNSGGNVPTKTSDLINDSGFVTSSALTNYVTTDTAQEITGDKVFKGSYKITCQSTASQGASIGFKSSSQSSSNYPIGVMEIDEMNNVMKFSVNAVMGPNYVPALGYFAGNRNYDYLAKLPKGNSKYSSIGSGDVYLPLSINNIKADSSGNIDITIPNAVSGTNNGTNWTSLTIGNDTYGLASGGSGSGPTVTKYDTSSYMTYSYSGSTTCTIYDGILNSDEFRIENTNPGDILLFDITLQYKKMAIVGAATYSKRYLIKIVVPVKSANTSYDSNNTGDISNSYELFSVFSTNWSNNVMQLTIENINSASTNRIKFGELNVPYYIGGSNTSGAIVINSITHIAF